MIGIAATLAFFMSDAQAILLDGLFNLTYFVTGLFTLKVARLLRRGESERYPIGYVYFAPMINATKALLILGVSVLAFIDSISALAGQGRMIEANIAVWYGLFATIVCWSLALIAWLAYRKTGSELIDVDARNWLVNGAISSAVLLAFVGLALAEGRGYDRWLPYFDPALVLIVVLLTIYIPFQMLQTAFYQLLNRAPDDGVTAEITESLTVFLQSLPVADVRVRVLQPGRKRFVIVYVLMPQSFKPESLAQLDEIRIAAELQLRSAYSETELDMQFTVDPSHGAFETAAV